MSYFFGCVSLNKPANLSEIASGMKSNMGHFKCDGEAEFKDEKIFVLNGFINQNLPSGTVYNVCKSDRFMLAASCRLDNRKELANELNLSEHINDHDYLLAAFSAWGDQCPEHLLGDFSFVIWDSIEDKLFLAKDQLGIRPLFYLNLNGILYFSTHIPAIKGAFQGHLALNDNYIAAALKVFPPPVGDTFFRDIRRLQPAHSCYFGINGLEEERRYWELKTTDLSRYGVPELYEQLTDLFTESVRCRVKTAKNVACQLSGGLDSSAITVLASRLLDKSRLHTFSFVLNDQTREYSEHKIDEQETQNEVIDFAKLQRENHHLIDEFYYKDVVNQLDKANEIMGGYADSDAIWQDSLFREAEKYNVGVSLSGFPGDECVSASGHLYFYDHMHAWNIRAIGAFLADHKINGVRAIVHYFRGKRQGTVKLNYRAVQEERSLLTPESEWTSALVDTSFPFFPTFKGILKNTVCRAHTSLRCESEAAYALQYGIETAYPLADLRLIQFVYSLPTDMFKPKPMPRMVFRNLCKGILPDKVRLQNKFNGAMTLAFVEYWQKKQFDEFESTGVKDHNGMFDLEKYNRMRMDYKENGGTPPLILHYLSELIRRNSV